MKYFARDIPHFISNYLGIKCDQLDSSPDIYKPEDNVELSKFCGNFRKVKNEGVKLYRQEGDPSYKQKADEFVRKYFVIPELFYAVDGGLILSDSERRRWGICLG